MCFVIPRYFECTELTLLYFFLIKGFNPVWNEFVKFTVKVPELVLVRFTVYDSDLGSDDFLGQFTAPLNCFKQGEF